jgi:hypothetical protein
MLRFLLRIFREVFYLHLLIPLVVSIGVGSVVARVTGSIAGLGINELIDFWIFDRIAELVAVYVSFIVVMVLLVQREIGVRIANLGALEETLSNSKGFFALAPISLSEWFEPSVQVYLARLFGQKTKTVDFRHERVLLFFTEGSLEDAHAPFLDGYYARCLIREHQSFGAELGFLGPSDIRTLIGQLSPKDRKALGCYPWIVRSLPDSILRYVHPCWLRRRIRELAFAIVTNSDGRSSVVRFSKGKRVLSVTPVDEDLQMRPFLEFAEAVRKRIYKPGTTSLSAKHDFAEQLAI